MPSSRLFLGLIPWYGLLIVVGAAIAILLADREASRLFLPKDTVLDLALWTLPAGILGARIYYVLFSWDVYRENPLSALFIWEGGLAILGGLLAGTLTVAVFARARRLNLLMLLDLLSPGVALAQAIGRWGNFFNQEAYGPALAESSPFAFFPLAVLINEASGPVWHVATFFLESIWNLGVFLFLIRGRRKLFRRTGDIFLFYLLGYSAGRLVIENLRMDSLYLTGGIRVSQLACFLICFTVTLVFLRRRHLQKADHRCFLPLCGTVLLLLDIPLVCFCLGLFRCQSPFQQTVALGLLSLLRLGLSLLLYGKSEPAQVCYALPKA